MLPTVITRSSFTETVTMSVAVLKMRVVVHLAWSESQWTVLVAHYLDKC